MKKIISIVILLCVLLPLFEGLGVSAAYVDGNIASKAKVTADFEVNPQWPLSNVYDGNTKTPCNSASIDTEGSFKFPCHVEFDFGSYNVQMSKFILTTQFGQGSGITNMGIQIMESGSEEWITLKENIELTYEQNGNVDEIREFYFSSRPKFNKLRFKINNANLSWSAFRINEIEIIGRINGYSNPLNVTESRAQYLKTVVGAQTAIDKIYVMTADGEEKALSAQFPAAAYENEGIYLQTGSIEFYDAVDARAIIDVYNPNRSIGAYADNWAYELVRNAIIDGLLGSIPTDSADYTVSRKDAALFLFRKLGMSTAYTENKYSDISEENTLAPVYLSVLNQGLFNEILTSNFFEAEKKMTRLEAVKLAAAWQKDVEVSAGMETAVPDFTDTEGLSENEKDIVTEAYRKGFLKNSVSFRPNDEVTLGEFLSMNTAAVDNDAVLVKKFTDNGEILKNPNMGLMLSFADNMPMKYGDAYDINEQFGDVAGWKVIYARPGWDRLNPGEGVYDFSYIDTLINRYKSRGAQVAIRITHTDGDWGTPKWVYDKGAKYFSGGSASRIMPVYKDEIWRSEYEKFLDVFADRYDGNKDVAFIEIGCGYWGEGNPGSQPTEFGLEDVKYFVDIFADRFKKTPMVLMGSMRGFNDGKEYAISKNMGTRIDSFTGASDHGPLVSGAGGYEKIKGIYDGMWQVGPCVIEPGHFLWCLDYWDKPEMFYEYVWDLHATYFLMHGYMNDMYNHDPEIYDNMAKMLGYRMLPQKVSMNRTVDANERRLNVDVSWQNLGAARMYNGAYPTITLKDKRGNIACVMTDTKFNAKDVEIDRYNPPVLNEQGVFNVDMTLPCGTYEVYLSLGSKTGVPEIAMPIEGNDGDLRYYIGDIVMEGDYDVSAEYLGENKFTVSIKFDEDCPPSRYHCASLCLIVEELGRNGTVSGQVTTQVITNTKEQKAKITEASALGGVAEFEADFNNLDWAADKLRGRRFVLGFDMSCFIDGAKTDIPRYTEIYPNNKNGGSVATFYDIAVLGYVNFDEDMNMTFEPVDN